MPTFKVICPTDSIPGLTAWSNDVDYCRALAEHIAPFINQHDLLIAISASGNSANILEAVKLARTQNARALASTGRAGGKLADVADFALHAPSDIIEQVEDIHLIIAHCLCVVLRDAIQARTEPVAVSVDNGNHGEIDRRVICSGVSATDN